MTEITDALAVRPPLSFPMPAEALLPQRPPMRFIDEALFVDESAAESLTTVRADSIAARADGRLPALALIEIMAQTIGLYAGAQEILSGRSPRPGLLLGTRRMSLPMASFAPGEVLRCRAEKAFSSDEGLWQFSCTVTVVRRADGSEASVPAGSAMLSVFNPPEGWQPG